VLSPPDSSPLQAETYRLLLATKLAEILEIQDPYFYTDSLVLASAAASPTVFKAPGHWDNRPHLAAIQTSPSSIVRRLLILTGVGILRQIIRLV
jgi:hypothetical protein